MTGDPGAISSRRAFLAPTASAVNVSLADATTWPQFFLKFLLGHEAVTAVIPGTTNPAHLADNISAGRGRFPDAKQRKAMIEFFESL